MDWLLERRPTRGSEETAVLAVINGVPTNVSRTAIRDALSLRPAGMRLLAAKAVRLTAVDDGAAMLPPLPADVVIFDWAELAREKVRYTVPLRGPVHRKLSIQARDEGKSLRQLLEAIIEDYAGVPQ